MRSYTFANSGEFSTPFDKVNMADQRRAAKIGLGVDVCFAARLTRAQQHINCYVACDKFGESHSMCRAIEHGER